MSAAARPFARSGFLIAMLVGAGVGTVVARSAESAIGGADPEFVGALGAAFGGILGRSLWMRVQRAREMKRPAAPTVLMLLARIALSVIVAFALFGPSSTGPVAELTTGGRTAVAMVGLVCFAVLGVVEYRWLKPSGESHVH
jgi:hypothetical protein